MSLEVDEIALYRESAFNFMMHGSEFKVTNCILTDNPQTDIPVVFWGYMGIYPRLVPPTLSATFIAFSLDSERDLSTYFKKILSLQIPDRIKELPIKQDDYLRGAMELIAAVEGMPSILLAIGETNPTTEEQIVLFQISGITPITALSEIREALRQVPDISD